MLAGLNCLIDIWRIDYDSDDVVGGAMVTGSLQYQRVHARIQANRDEQLLLQQGLETIRTFGVVVGRGDLDIRERDEFEVSAPIDHEYYGDRFRIVTMQYSSHAQRDPRKYIILQAQRSVRAKSRQ